MVIQVTGSTYTDPSGAVYYQYQSEQAPTGQYAEGSFLIQTKRGQVRYTQEQAQELAARSSAKYLDIPLYEISGYEQTAPAGAIIGGTLAAQASREQAYQTQQAQLRERREIAQSGFSGTFTPYTQYVATQPIGAMVGTPQQYKQIQYLQSPTAQWASESVFAQKAAQLAPYAPAGTTFRGQIVQPLPALPPTMQAPSYLPTYESPFKGYVRPETPGKYAGLATYGIFERASQTSTGLQARFETAIGYDERAHPIIKFASGFGSAFTGLPAFGGAALVGAEYYVRHPPKNALVRTLPVLAAVPGAKKTAFELIASAKTKPFETAGMFTGMAVSGRGVKVGTPSLKGIKALVAEERAVSYVPTFERARAEPLAVPKVKVQVMERTQGHVLPSLKGLQVVGETKLKPLTELKVISEVQTKTRVQLKPTTAVQTRVRVLALPIVRTQTLPATRLQTRAMVQTKPLISTKALVAVKPLTRTMPAIKVQPMTKTMPAVQTQTLTKTLTQTRTRTKTMPMLSTQLMLRKPTKTKLATMTSEFKFKAPSIKGFGKFGEIAKVASTREILGGRKVRRSLF